MKTASFHILRVGLAITFLWIGVLILKQPEAWGGYLQSWVVSLLPIPVDQAMIGTAVLDMVIGGLLLIDSFTWLAASVAALHLIIILTLSGITDITVRNIAILSAAISVVVDSFPSAMLNKIRFWRKANDQN